ncbi:MAG: alpha/beta fold hydrolase [Actinomycetota bacterium]|nr:alpha/beta fold hydrolase [Actinomycetota bacterium]
MAQHAPQTDSDGARRALDETLLERLRRGLPATSNLKASIALDLDRGQGWTVSIAGPRMSLAAGVDPRADTTVIADPTTLLEVFSGKTSGVKAFLDGRLRVRGNLALSLRLGGLFGDDDAPPRFERARDVRAAGLDTFYLEAGAGPPVVLLHGLGATNASMLPTLWDLSQDHRVMAPDLPGFGESSKPIRSYDAAFYAQWLVAFLDEVGVERASLIGNSMGGRVAIEGALHAPDRVHRLVLFAPSPAFIKKRQFVELVRVLRPEMALLPLRVPHKQVVRSIKRLFAQPGRLADPWYDAAADEFIRIFSTPRGRIAFFSAARQIYLEEPHGDTGFWDRLRELAPPSLFIWGQRDKLVPAGFARHVERALPDATSIVLDDCGHVPQYELPDKAHELAREFLAG